MFLIDLKLFIIGRRILLLCSMVGMCIAATLIPILVHFEGNRYLIVVLFMVFVFTFGIGLGGIPWLVVPELIPIHAVSSAGAICTAINWGSSFVVGLVTPLAFELCISHIHSLIFNFFSALQCLLLLCWIIVNRLHNHI